MKYYPEDVDDRKEAAKLNAEDWMIEALRMNPTYLGWGPHEDYMMGNEKYPNAWDNPIFIDTWKKFDWKLNDLNEIVNFYFQVERASKECQYCDGNGENPKTKKLSDDWYTHLRTDGKEGWGCHLEQEDVQALWDNGRLFDFRQKNPDKVPSAAEVNIWSHKGMGHDSINRYICVKARAERSGFYGLCEVCGGDGAVWTEPKAKLGLVLWVLHPRKGCSRGVEIKKITKAQLPKVVEYLREASKRNTERFAGLN